MRQIEAISPHGFCAGVTNAIEKAMALPPGAYCLHELVHNQLVIDDLSKRGIRFVEDIEEVPEGSVMMFSAHGVSPMIRERARQRKLKVVDATCPFVAKVHKDASRFSEQGLPVVIVGKRNHIEVIGVAGEVKPGMAYIYPDLPDAKKIGVVAQTTVNSDEVTAVVNELGERYEVNSAATVCNATRDRQNAVRAFKGDLLLVLGSANSSNTRRLVEIAPCHAIMVSDMDELHRIDLAKFNHIGITSGASTPESFFSQAFSYLSDKISAASSLG